MTIKLIRSGRTAGAGLARSARETRAASRNRDFMIRMIPKTITMIPFLMVSEAKSLRSA
jgi:hypothetical protein